MCRISLGAGSLSVGHKKVIEVCNMAYNTIFKYRKVGMYFIAYKLDK